MDENFVYWNQKDRLKERMCKRNNVVKAKRIREKKRFPRITEEIKIRVGDKDYRTSRKGENMVRIKIMKRKRIRRCCG